jgi:hypothetical protein
MSTIGGKKREQSSASSADFTKKVGLFEAEVVAVNPNAEEYKDILGMELKEDSKATEYLGTSQNGNKTLRIDFWLEEVKSKEKFKVTFFLEDLVKENKDNTKKQYINAVGMCSWADDPNNLYEWFTNREYRPAFVGEEDLYNFLRTWLGNLDLRDAESTLEIEWKKLMNGNVRDIKQLIGGEFVTNVIALATIKSVIKDGDTKEYQAVYNKAFLPAYTLKNFRLLDYSNNSVLSALRAKKSKELKPHERFVINITGEYGCKDFYTFKDLKDYNPDDNLVASDKVIADDDSDF